MRQLDDAIREHLSYNAETGEFTRLTGTYKGRPVGTKDSQGYIVITILGERHMAHRVAWFLHYGKNPVGQLDHINRTVDDNRICNLREVSPSENLFNQKASDKNNTGIRGVWWEDNRKKYKACLSYKGTNHYLGRYKHLHQAVIARLEAEYKYYPPEMVKESSAMKWLKSNYA